jgi:hypothetical protein
MARPVALWIGAAVLACALCAAVYLPPRDLPRWAWHIRGEYPPSNPSRLRARKLAAEWREANASLEAIRHREEVNAAIEARTGAGLVGPGLITEGPDTTMVRLRPLIQAGFDSIWARLGIGESKIRVAVLVRDPDRLGALRRLQVEGGYGISFILPDTSDRTTCMTLARSPFWFANRRYIPKADLLNWTGTVLGTCAFYARFGMPSPRVEQWLARRDFDLALVPGWDDKRPFGRDRWELEDENVRDRWWDWQLYSYPRPVAGCFAGRAEVCRRVLVAADLGPEGRRPRVVAPRDRWDAARTLMVGSDQFLSEVVKRIGPDRFQEFWTTSLPVDSALSLALREPVGDFIVRYERAMGPAPRFGAATTPLDAGLGIVFSVLVVGLVMAAQGRRRVR